MTCGRILLLVVSLLVSLNLGHYIPRDVSSDVDPVANISDLAASNLEAFTKADLSTRTQERLTRRTGGRFRTAKEINADPIRQRTSVSPQSLYNDVALAIRLVRETKIQTKKAQLLCVKISADGNSDDEDADVKPIVWGPNSKNRIDIKMEITTHTRKSETSPTITHRYLVGISTIGATRQWGPAYLPGLDREYTPGRFLPFDWSHMKDEMNIMQLQELVRSSKPIQGLHLSPVERNGPYADIIIWQVPVISHMGPTITFDPRLSNACPVNVDLATWRVFTTRSDMETEQHEEEMRHNRQQNEEGFQDYAPHTRGSGTA